MWLLAVNCLLAAGIVAFIVIGVCDTRAHNGRPLPRVTQPPPRTVPSFHHADMARARAARARHRRPGGPA